MAFVNQYGKVGDNKCGAYSIAYWEWIHFNDRRPNMGDKDGDDNYVDKIYNDIRFGDRNKIGMYKDFSDPKKMIKYIREKTYFTRTVLINSNANLQKNYGEYFGALCTETKSLPDLNPGEYAILILSDKRGPQHYVLVEGAAGGINVIDPGDGIEPKSPYPYNISKFDPSKIRTSPSNNYFNSGAAIYIR